jgi:hypothetical protein
MSFKLFLKRVDVTFSLVISDGSSFHKFGAAAARVPSPVVFFELNSNVGGASIKKRQSDLRRMSFLH